MKKYISIDIGGTAIKYGILTEDAQFLKSFTMKTESHLGGAGILSKVCRIVEELVTQEEISGVAISTAGVVDCESGVILHSAPLIPDFVGTNFKKTVEERFHLPCEVENDVNCAGLAEYVSGAAKGCKNMLMLTVGTGIGGCAVVNGRILHGACNAACEVGYMHMKDSDFQTLGAASILTKKVAAWKHEPEEKWDGYRIFTCAKEGDAQCIQAIDEMVSVLGTGIANICYVLNPEVVVLGGGIMAQEEYLKDKIEASVKSRLIPHIAKSTKIVFAKYQNDAGMLGALYHFWNCQKTNIPHV